MHTKKKTFFDSVMQIQYMNVSVYNLRAYTPALNFTGEKFIYTPEKDNKKIEKEFANCELHFTIKHSRILHYNQTNGGKI